MAGAHTRGSVLFRLKDGQIETATEQCTRTPLTTVVSDSLGFAAISSEIVETSTTGERRVYASHVLIGRYPAANRP
jgi:hypothetical protein